MEKLTVGLFNDSFPPTIDGVANVTVNYARIIEARYGHAIVATPYYPNVVDDYPFEVLRYPSAYVGKQLMGYRVGSPAPLGEIGELARKDIDIIHTHCPFVSTLLARELRAVTDAPVVFTYHTKFDIDIEKSIAFDPLRKASIKFLLGNINACDEVWVVSEGAGKNLRSLGYTGEMIAMRNGTDFVLGRADDGAVEALCARHGIPAGVPVFLFVGRMMWYKGVRLSLDGLRAARDMGMDFRFILVGDGADLEEIRAYVKKLSLEENCIFTGAIRDRELLRAYFTLSALFLFPSTFDTNGIVVSEAAACFCPSLLVAGSCAAEDIVHGETGLIIDETTESMRDMLLYAAENPDALRTLGENAARLVYHSWDEAVAEAYARYQIVRARGVKREDASRLAELRGSAAMFINDALDAFEEARELFDGLLWSTKDRVLHLRGNTPNWREIIGLPPTEHDGDSNERDDKKNGR